MADNETASLRNEILRLNNIIDILLESNQQLKNALAFYQQTAILPANLFDAYPQQTGNIEMQQRPVHNRVEGTQNDNNHTPSGTEEAKNLLHGIYTGLDGVNIVRDGIASQTDGVNIVQSLISSKLDGVNIVQSLISSKLDGVNIVQRPISSKLGGVNIVRDGTSPQADGVNNVQRPIGSGSDGVNNVQNPVLKTKKEVKPIRYQHLLGLLREVNGRATWFSTEHTAEILMRLETTPKQSIKDLQKLTGLSEDGMVKRMMSMKKFGLITRGAGRTLLLTARAIAILDKARNP